MRGSATTTIATVQSIAIVLNEVAYEPFRKHVGAGGGGGGREQGELHSTTQARLVFKAMEKTPSQWGAGKHTTHLDLNRKSTYCPRQK